MRTEDANRIPLSEILKKLGHSPASQKGNDLWYLSPLRDEKTPSFHVHAGKNFWYDHGGPRGGTAIDFVCAYLALHQEDHTVADALRWLGNMMHSAIIPPHLPQPEVHDDTPALELRRIMPLQNSNLIKYLYSRGIPFSSAKRYLKEACIFNKNSGKFFYTLALENENHGHELRNRAFKGSIGAKTISFFRGMKTLPDEVHVFEGMMDFLSALAYEKTPQLPGDAIILNSVGCLPMALPYIRNYSYRTAHSWLDNDTAGENASRLFHEFTMAQRDLKFNPMNHVYAGHKDVNAWHMHRLEL